MGNTKKPLVFSTSFGEDWKMNDEEFLTLCLRCNHNCKQGDICKGFMKR